MEVSNPLQRVIFGTVGQDQFPVYAPDGFTKVPGLTTGDFAVIVYVNGVVQGAYPTPVITAIGTTGEYLIQFQTLARGRLEIEVVVAAQTYRWKGFYDIVDSDIFPGQTFYDVLRDRRGNGLPSVIVEVFAYGTATVLYSTETDFDGAYEIPLSGNLATHMLVDLRYSGDSFPAILRRGVVLG